MIQNKDKQLFETQKHLNEIQIQNNGNHNIKTRNLPQIRNQKTKKIKITINRNRKSFDLFFL